MISTTKMIVVKNTRLNGSDVRPGQEIDLPDDLVKRWRAAGLVRSAAEPKEKPDRKRPNRKTRHEKTVKEPGERAVK